MQTLTKRLLSEGVRDRVLSDTQLSRFVSGSAQRRYHLVNRAVAAGDLVRLRRGRYVLAASLRRVPPHPFALAQAFEAGSYVSFETALSYHGWIPEAVRVVASVTPGRKKHSHDHALFGSFSFHPLALEAGYFLTMVERVALDGQTALVASPTRALMDLVCLRKQEWQGMAWLVDSLRIDREQLERFTNATVRRLSCVYQHERVRRFLSALATELGHD
ncbi:MAG: hypothetical protein ABI411_11170 [Tahibacter sp.]